MTETLHEHEWVAAGLGREICPVCTLALVTTIKADLEDAVRRLNAAVLRIAALERENAKLREVVASPDELRLLERVEATMSRDDR